MMMGKENNNTRKDDDGHEQQQFQEEKEEEKGNGDSEETKKLAPIHEKVASIKHNENIEDRYEIVKQIQEGTIGIVSKVKMKKKKNNKNNNHNAESIGSSYKNEGILKKVYYKTTRLSSSLSNDLIHHRQRQQQQRKDDVYYAMKTIRLDCIHRRRNSNHQLHRLENEIIILNRLDHPYIVRLQEVYNIQQTHLHIIMDYCDGGNLYCRFPYSEKSASRITYQLLSAIQYLHDHGIVHRDLKLEHIMFESKSFDANIKLIGFGLSSKYLNCDDDNHHPNDRRVGNIYTKAPEVLSNGIYTPQSDLWSVGVILYMLLSLGEYPFFHPNLEKLIDIILNAKYASMDDDNHYHHNHHHHHHHNHNNNHHHNHNHHQHHHHNHHQHHHHHHNHNHNHNHAHAQTHVVVGSSSSSSSQTVPVPRQTHSRSSSSSRCTTTTTTTTVWNTVSDDAKDLIRSLLVVDPNLRMNSIAAMDHPWLQQKNRYKKFLQQQLDETQHQKEVGNVLYEYCTKSSPLKKIALNVIARRSTAQEITELRKVFEVYDTTNNGVISYDELKKGLKKSNLSDQTIAEIFESIDVNHTGTITYTEFLAATLATRGTIEDERIAEAFDTIDIDHTGYISKENLRNLLGNKVNDDIIDEIIHEIDLNNDGKISYKEFRAEFRSKNKLLQNHRSKTN